MAAIRPASSPQEFDMLIIAEDMVVLMAKLLWIADIQFLMTEPDALARNPGSWPSDVPPRRSVSWKCVGCVQFIMK